MSNNEVKDCTSAQNMPIPVEKHIPAVLKSGRINLKKLFTKVSVADYAAMWFLAENAAYAQDTQKFYLKELAQAAEIPMPIITQMVRKLQDKGLVIWTHDGCGEQGTYIQLTENGIEALIEQRNILTEFETDIISRFGKERFLHLMSEMAAFEELMNKSAESEDTERGNDE